MGKSGENKQIHKGKDKKRLELRLQEQGADKGTCQLDNNSVIVKFIKNLLIIFINIRWG